jgi:hypothetical protein
MLCRTYVFTSGGICGSHSAFQCIWGVKCRRTIFHARVGPYGFHKKRPRTRYAEHVFFHSVGYVGHLVHSGASGTQNVIALFFIHGWDRYGFDKKHAATLLRRTYFFASDGICGSHRALQCIGGMKFQCTIFHAQVGTVWLP